MNVNSIPIFSTNNQIGTVTSNTTSSTSNSQFELVATELNEGEFTLPSEKEGKIISNVVEIIAIDYFGIEIEFEDEATICLEVNDTQSLSDSCLGFFDVKDNEWKCEDPCLEVDNDGRACGTTNHFTSFAVLFQGTGAGKCASDSDNQYYILHSGWQDMLLVLGCSIFIFVFLVLLAIFMSNSRIGRSIMLGREGDRILNVRKVRHNLQKGKSGDLSSEN